jgi:hypothetical protein
LIEAALIEAALIEAALIEAALIEAALIEVVNVVLVVVQIVIVQSAVVVQVAVVQVVIVQDTIVVDRAQVAGAGRIRKADRTEIRRPSKSLETEVPRAGKDVHGRQDRERKADLDQTFHHERSMKDTSVPVARRGRTATAYRNAVTLPGFSGHPPALASIGLRSAVSLAPGRDFLLYNSQQLSTFYRATSSFSQPFDSTFFP